MTKTRITNIVVQGLLKVRGREKLECLVRERKNIKVLGNTIRLKQVVGGDYFNFTLYLNRYFYLLTVRNKLKRSIRVVFKKKYRISIRVIGLRIINVHEKLIIDHNTESLKTSFLRRLNHRFNIKSVLIGPQEDNCINAPIDTAHFIESSNSTYSSIAGKISVSDKKHIYFKIQLDRFQIVAHCTFLFPSYTERTKEVITFFEREAVNSV